MATSPLPSRGPTIGRNCRITPAFSGVPNVKRGEKIRSGSLTHAFSQAHKWAEWQRNPCIIGGPQTREQNRSGCLTPTFSRAHKWAEICVTPSFSGVPNTKHGKKFRNGCLTLAFSGAHMWGELLHNPYILGGPQTMERNQNWVPHPCPLESPQMGGNASSPLHSRGSPTPSTGRKSELAASPLPSPGPTSGRNRYVTPAFSAVPKQGNEIRIGYLTPAMGRIATSPLHSRGFPTQSPGKKSDLAVSPLPSRGAASGRNCYVTPAFSGVPKQGNKIKSGCIGDNHKTVDMRPERRSPKIFAQMVCLH